MEKLHIQRWRDVPPTSSEAAAKAVGEQPVLRPAYTRARLTNQVSLRKDQLMEPVDTSAHKGDFSGSYNAPPGARPP